MKITPIKTRRINAGIETNEAVEQLGISKSTFYKLEQGHQEPSAKLIARIAKVYNCTTDEVFEDFNIRG
jgi:putative transcriptional regulator